jgi:acetyl esterase/lipase
LFEVKQINISIMLKWLKRILLFLSGVLVLLLLLLLAPLAWSSLNPDKPPLGYFPGELVYIAGYTGIEKLIDRKPSVPAGIRELKDIEYRNIGGKSLKMDMYIPDNLSKPAPLLLFVHGGGWRSGERSDYLVYLVDFAKKGYVTATVSYRLVADSCYPACVEDVREAVRWLVVHSAEYGYDPDRLAIIGGSAGGHLALLTAYGWKKPEEPASDSLTRHIRAVVDIYGPYDMTTEYARNQWMSKAFINHSYEEAPELYLQSSPKHYLSGYVPPTLIFHGTSDRLVPVSQSDSLAAALDKLNVPFDYCRISGWPHVMDLSARVNRYMQFRMNLFFDQYLKGSQ